MTSYDETAGAVILAVSLVAVLIPMGAIWLATVRRRVRKRQAAIDATRRTHEQHWLEVRDRLDAIADHADVSAIERGGLIQMLRILAEEDRKTR